MVSYLSYLNSFEIFEKKWFGKNKIHVGGFFWYNVHECKYYTLDR